MDFEGKGILEQKRWVVKPDALPVLTGIGPGHYHNLAGIACSQVPVAAAGNLPPACPLGISIAVVRLTLAQVAEVRVLYPQPRTISICDIS